MAEQNANTWVHDRLVLWGTWNNGGFQGAYYTQSSFLNDRFGRGFEALTREIEVIDKAVARVRLSDRRKYQIIRRRYIRGLPIEIISSELNMTIEKTDTLLWAAQSEVGRHITELERLDSAKKKPKIASIAERLVRPEETKPA